MPQKSISAIGWHAINASYVLGKKRTNRAGCAAFTSLKRLITSIRPDRVVSPIVVAVGL